MKRSRVYNQQLESSYLFWTSPHLYIVSKKHRSTMMKICIYIVRCQFNSGFRTQLDGMITSRNQVVHQFLNKAMKNKDISNFEDFFNFLQFRNFDSHMIGTVLLDFDICMRAEKVIHLRRRTFFALDRFNRESEIDVTKSSRKQYFSVLFTKRIGCNINLIQGLVDLIFCTFEREPLARTESQGQLRGN